MFGPHSPFFFLLPRSYVLTITSLKVCTTYAGYKLWELCRRYRREISQSICGNKGKKLCWNTSMYCFMNNPGSTRNCQKVIRLTVYIYYIHEPSLTSHMSWPVTERLWYLFKPNAHLMFVVQVVHYITPSKWHSLRDFWRYEICWVKGAKNIWFWFITLLVNTHTSLKRWLH